MAARHPGCRRRSARPPSTKCWRVEALRKVALRKLICDEEGRELPYGYAATPNRLAAGGVR